MHTTDTSIFDQIASPSGALNSRDARPSVSQPDAGGVLFCECCGNSSKPNCFPRKGRKTKRFREKTGLTGNVCKKCIRASELDAFVTDSSAVIALQKAMPSIRKGHLSAADLQTINLARNALANLRVQMSKMVKEIAIKTERSNSLLSMVLDAERLASVILCSTYEARRKQANYVISKLELRLLVFGRDEWKCKLCGREKNLTVDHLIPVLRGGTDDLENLQTLCGSCNSKKGAK